MASAVIVLEDIDVGARAAIAATLGGGCGCYDDVTSRRRGRQPATPLSRGANPGLPSQQQQRDDRVVFKTTHVLVFAESVTRTTL